MEHVLELKCCTVSAAPSDGSNTRRIVEPVTPSVDEDDVAAEVAPAFAPAVAVVPAMLSAPPASLIP